MIYAELIVALTLLSNLPGSHSAEGQYIIVSNKYIRKAMRFQLNLVEEPWEH